MNCKLPSITISGLVLSDLFFNSPLEHYNAVNRELPAEVEEREALLKDAIVFQETIGCESGNGLSPAMLVEDFLARV